MLKNILSFGADFAKDYLLEAAVERLSTTFTKEQQEQFEKMQKIQDISYYLFLSAILLIPASLILSNYLFFWQDVGFWTIFLTNVILIPSYISYAIYYKGRAFIQVAKFYSGIKDNLKQLSKEEQERFSKVIARFKD